MGLCEIRISIEMKDSQGTLKRRRRRRGGGGGGEKKEDTMPLNN
jgi:hypothetical protein